MQGWLRSHPGAHPALNRPATASHPPCCPTPPAHAAGKTWCGGTVLQCLSERYADIEEGSCQAEDEFFRRMRAKGDLK